MSVHETLYIAGLLVSIPLIGTSLYYVLDNLQLRGAQPLAVLLSGTIVWLLAAFMLTIASTFRVALWANRLQYVGIVVVPLSFAVFALLYSDREQYVNGYSIGLLSIEPIAVLALVVTSQSHDIWRESIVPSGEQYVVDGAQVTCDAVICFGPSGPGFQAHLLYSYVVLLIGAGLILSRALQSDAIPRGQAVSMLIAVVAPIVGNVASLFVLPAGAPDLTPVTFTIMGLAMVLGLYRYSLVETDALSGSVDVKTNERPAVLVDDENRIVELNIGAAAVLGVDADQVVGEDVDEVFGEQEDLLSAFETDPLSPGGLELADPISGDRYEVTATEVSPEGTPRSGWLYVFSPFD